MKRPKLILVYGLPGTGKTTFAVALAEALAVRHLNSDMLRQQAGKRGKYDSATKASIYQELLDQTKALLENRENVIVDATFFKEALRTPFIQVAEQIDAEVRWIELKASEAVIQERVSKKRQYSEADFEVYRTLKKAHEPLNETHLVLWSDQLSIPEMIEKAKEYLFVI